MTKKEYCLKNPAIAYYSGLNGLEIHGIEYGINDYVYCVSGAWGGGKAYHKLKINYGVNGDYIEISENALRCKNPMYIDTPTGEAKQVGYVITGKTEFEDRENYRWSTQYIDLWVTIITVIDTEFEEV